MGFQKREIIQLLLDCFRSFKKQSKLLGDENSFRMEVSTSQEAFARSHFCEDYSASLPPSRSPMNTSHWWELTQRFWEVQFSGFQLLWYRREHRSGGLLLSCRKMIPYSFLGTTLTQITWKWLYARHQVEFSMTGPELGLLQGSIAYRFQNDHMGTFYCKI